MPGETIVIIVLGACVAAVAGAWTRSPRPALFIVVAVLIWMYADRRWRPIAVLLLVVSPIVAVPRLYQGVHHLGDVLASLVAISLWLVVMAVLVLKSAVDPADGDARGDPRASPAAPGDALRAPGSSGRPTRSSRSGATNPGGDGGLSESKERLTEREGCGRR